MSRVLKTGENQITCTYAAHCANVAAGRAWAQGVDAVKYKAQIDKVTAHSAGTVIKAVDYIKGHEIDREAMGYGNYVMIQHDNYYVTLYAHLEAVYVREGQVVNQGDEIGLMGNTGNSFGAHLHFEVRKYKAAPTGNLHDVNAYEWLDPTEYLDAELPAVKAVPGAALNVVKAGVKVKLRDTPVYSSEGGKSYGRRSGTYFVWSDEVKNGRVRMTNSAARVGVKGEVSFWVALADIGATKNEKMTDTSTVAVGETDILAESVSGVGNAVFAVKAGAKVKLKDTPVYNSETAVKAVGRRSGTYYVWSDEVKNGRVRMTNSEVRVGERGQVSFWVDIEELSEY